MQFSKFPAFITPDGKKVPLFAGWQEQATTDKKQLDAWEAHYRPGLGSRFIWGIPCGEVNGIYALDIDIKGNGWQTIQDRQLVIPDTIAQRTLSGGAHFLFKYPKNVQLGNKVKFLPGLDTRSNGGWIAEYNLDLSKPLADIPTWLIEAVGTKKEYTATIGELAYALSDSVKAAKLSEILKTIRSAPEGEGNNILNAQAFEMGRLLTTGALSRLEAEQLLHNAATERGRDSYEATATIKSGLDGGLRAPLTCPFNAVTQLMQTITPPPPQLASRWTPRPLTLFDLQNTSKLKRPVLFADWSTKDISMVNADGGTGKTTMLLQEAACMAIGERFMGLECKEPGGKTLFITGEDSFEKLGAILGQITKQMGLWKEPNDPRLQRVLDCVLIKNEHDMCFVTKTKEGFYTLDPLALSKLREACSDIRPAKVVVDPIASFWGPESAANDTGQALIKFARSLVKEFDCCFEMVNHLGKDMSRNKDMTQFGGRGGSAIPSHSRVSKSMRRLADDELKDYLDYELDPDQSAILCIINKFTDGSALYMEPFLMIRTGYLFSPAQINKATADIATVDHVAMVLAWVKSVRADGKYPTKPIVYSQFMGKSGFSKQKITDAIEHLIFWGHEGVKFCISDHPLDASNKTKVITLIDEKGNEVLR